MPASMAKNSCQSTEIQGAVSSSRRLREKTITDARVKTANTSGPMVLPGSRDIHPTIASHACIDANSSPSIATPIYERLAVAINAAKASGTVRATPYMAAAFVSVWPPSITTEKAALVSAFAQVIKAHG
jgi:hypothetical protein